MNTTLSVAAADGRLKPAPRLQRRGAILPLAVASASHGSCTLDPDGSFVYVPNAGYVGPDSFTYQACDGTHYSNVATVSLAVTGVVPACRSLRPRPARRPRR